MNGKVLNDAGSGTTSMLSSGIFWAADNGAHVIKMSLGGSDDCDPTWAEDWLDIGRSQLRDAINHAWSKNVVLVAAAGNDAADSPIWPADRPHVQSVANTNSSDAKSTSSNFGLWVDVAAPGSVTRWR